MVVFTIFGIDKPNSHFSSMGLISTLLSPLGIVLKLIELSIPILRIITIYGSFYHIWY